MLSSGSSSSSSTDGRPLPVWAEAAPSWVQKICMRPRKQVHLQDLVERNPILRKLRPFQREGVRFIVERGGRILLVDDMLGLGKTVQISVGVPSCSCCRESYLCRFEAWVYLVHFGRRVCVHFMHSRRRGRGSIRRFVLASFMGSFFPSKNKRSECRRIVVGLIEWNKLLVFGLLSILVYPAVCRGILFSKAAERSQ